MCQNNISQAGEVRAPKDVARDLGDDADCQKSVIRFCVDLTLIGTFSGMMGRTSVRFSGEVGAHEESANSDQ